MSGYMLMGIYFLVLHLSCISDKIAEVHKKPVVFLMCACFFITTYGTVETLFGRDKYFDPSYVKPERGQIVDVGSKAAGYIVRKYVHPYSQVLAIHRAVEPPNLFYFLTQI